MRIQLTWSTSSIVPLLSLQYPRFAPLRTFDPSIERKPGHRHMCLRCLCPADVSKKRDTHNGETQLLTRSPIDLIIRSQRLEVTVSYIDILVCFGDWEHRTGKVEYVYKLCVACASREI